MGDVKLYQGVPVYVVETSGENALVCSLQEVAAIDLFDVNAQAEQAAPIDGSAQTDAPKTDAAQGEPATPAETQPTEGGIV